VVQPELSRRVVRAAAPEGRPARTTALQPTEAPTPEQPMLRRRSTPPPLTVRCVPSTRTATSAIASRECAARARARRSALHAATRTPAKPMASARRLRPASLTLLTAWRATRRPVVSTASAMARERADISQRAPCAPLRRAATVRRPAPTLRNACAMAPERASPRLPQIAAEPIAAVGRSARRLAAVPGIASLGPTAKEPPVCRRKRTDPFAPWLLSVPTASAEAFAARRVASARSTAPRMYYPIQAWIKRRVVGVSTMELSFARSRIATPVLTRGR